MAEYAKYEDMFPCHELPKTPWCVELLCVALPPVAVLLWCRGRASLTVLSMAALCGAASAWWHEKYWLCAWGPGGLYYRYVMGADVESADRAFHFREFSLTSDWFQKHRLAVWATLLAPGGLRLAWSVLAATRAGPARTMDVMHSTWHGATFNCRTVNVGCTLGGGADPAAAKAYDEDSALLRS
jgi:hypothetical protein